VRKGEKTDPSGKGEVALGLPLSGADVPVGLRDPAEHGDGEPDGEVGHVVGEDVGGVGDPDPALAALGEVDAVDADGEGGDDLELGEGVDEIGVGAVLGVADDGADGPGVGAEEGVAAFGRGLPEPDEAAAAVQLLLQVRVEGVQHQHAQGLHGRGGGGGRGGGCQPRTAPVSVGVCGCA
jgi:hypothetical protein